MSQFCVGQRVRIARIIDNGDEAALGMEGVVNEVDIAIYEGPDRGGIGVTIAGLCPQPQDGHTWNETDWCFFPEELEPLNPPKSQIDEILLMQNLPDRDCQKVAA